MLFIIYKSVIFEHRILIIMINNLLNLIPVLIGLSTCLQAQNCLIADYMFSGNANDASIYQNHGNVSGAILTIDRFSNPNSALLFDGINDQVNFGNPQELNFTTNGMYTFSFWIKTCSFIEQRIFSKRSNYAGIEIITINNKLLPYVGDVNNNFAWQITTSDPVTDCNWHYFVVIFDGVLNQITVYQNNQNTNLPINTANVSGQISNTSNAYIGTSELGSFFNGVIDDFKIYNCKLSEAEIGDLFFQGVGLHNDSTDPIIRVYPNPTTDYVVINYNNSSEAMLNIYSIHGQLIHSQYTTESVQLNTSQWNKGVYWVEMKNSHFLSTSKLIIK